MIPVRTGNLGVWRMRAALLGEPLPDPAEERSLLPHWRALGAAEVEDYIAWTVVEPDERGRFDWSIHRENARAAHKAGLRYAAYPWAHALPGWFRNGPGHVPGRCLEHGQAGALPSLFAESTWQVTHRFWNAVREGLGDVIDTLAVAFPADYGEAAFPSGVADWLIRSDPPRNHQHAGLWCDEREARLVFQTEIRSRYEEPARLARAWGLFERMAWETCPYPWDLEAGARGAESRRPVRQDGPSLAHKLDFARFYRGTLIRRLDALLAHVRQLFPRTPLEFKLGHCSEALELGADWAALVDLAGRHKALVRFTGAAMGEVFTRRLAALCRDRGVRFGTEAPREIPVWSLAQRAAHDAAAGPVSFFEFPEQLQAAQAALAAVAPVLGRAPRRSEVALLYPGAGRLEIPGHGAPDAAVACWPVLRRVLDVDLLDERAIAHGELGHPASGGTRALILLDGGSLPLDALDALAEWLAAGGVLIASPARPLTARVTDEVGCPHDVTATGEAARDALLAQLAPLPTEQPLAAQWPLRVDGVELRPGEPGSRLFLGPGWHGPDDGRWAFAEAEGEAHGGRPAGPFSARWSGPAASLLLPCPMPARDTPDAGRLQLVLQAFRPPEAAEGEVIVACGGEIVARRTWSGAATLRIDLPMRSAWRPGALLSISIFAPGHVPAAGGRSGDRRELGLLVRRVALHTDSAHEDSGSDRPRSGTGDLSAGESGPPLRVQGSGWPFERGVVLRGDGTPLAALAWLQSWLAGELSGLPEPPDPPRDSQRQAEVTHFDGGVLIFNPHPERGCLARLIGRDLPAEAAAGPLALAPLATQWCPRAD